MRLISEVYEEVIERILERNVVNDLVELSFLESATDEELTAYYSGQVDKEALIEDTLRNLEGSQKKLRILISNKETFLKTYGDKNADADFGRTPKRATEDGSEQASGSGNAEGHDQGGEGVESPYSGTDRDNDGNRGN